MREYKVVCSHERCGSPAEYKIASRWSDGVTAELKTYALCCGKCLANEYDRSLTKKRLCRLASGETLEVPAIYELCRGRRDQVLQRREDLEQAVAAEATAGS